MCAHPGQLQAGAKNALERVATVVGQEYARAEQQYRTGQVVWLQAESGDPGAGMLHRVARLLACRGPMTRTEILKQLGDVPAGFGHRALMDDLYRMLREFPMFCEVVPGRWQVGRRGVDFGGELDGLAA